MTVVDLDGTLLRGNSFRHFVLAVLRIALRRQPLRALWLCVLLALSRLHFVSHRRIKWQLMRLADAVMTPADYRRFALHLKELVDPAVLAILGHDADFVLASAASAEYVAPFVELMGWKNYVATCRPKSGRFADYTECRGEAKVRAVRRLRPGAVIDKVLTDHLDDLPLLVASAGRRILVRPSATTLAAVRMAGINPEVIE